MKVHLVSEQVTLQDWRAPWFVFQQLQSKNDLQAGC